MWNSHPILLSSRWKQVLIKEWKYLKSSLLLQFDEKVLRKHSCIHLPIVSKVEDIGWWKFREKKDMFIYLTSVGSSVKQVLMLEYLVSAEQLTFKISMPHVSQQSSPGLRFWNSLVASLRETRRLRKTWNDNSGASFLTGLYRR